MSGFQLRDSGTEEGLIPHWFVGYHWSFLVFALPRLVQLDGVLIKSKDDQTTFHRALSSVLSLATRVFKHGMYKSLPVGDMKHELDLCGADLLDKMLALEEAAGVPLCTPKLHQVCTVSDRWACKVSPR